MRPIDVDELEKVLIPEDASGGFWGYGTLKVILDQQPTVELVQYGKWRKECYMGDCDYYCSLCGTHALYIENSFDEVLSKYCPNCGAKMYG